MDKSALLAMAVEVLGTLLFGFVVGTLYARFMLPKVLARLGSFASLVNSPANILMSALFVLLVLGLAVATHASFASETLAWLAAHPGLLFFQPTPDRLRYFSLGATWFTGYLLATFPSDAMVSEDTRA